MTVVKFGESEINNGQTETETLKVSSKREIELGIEILNEGSWLIQIDGEFIIVFYFQC